MQSRIQNFTEMSTEEISDEMVWIDWRSEEREVIETFSDLLPVEDQLSCDDPDNPTTIAYRGEKYPNPLTFTPSDRYVTIFFITEIIKPDYHIYTAIESCDGDTHGFLVFTDSELRELQTTYASWFKKRLKPLALGIDGFSGHNIPYYGNELSGASGLAEKLERGKTKIAKQRERTVGSHIRKKPFWKFW